MATARAALILCIVANTLPSLNAQSRSAPQPSYFPERFDWQRREPAQAGIDAAKLDAAVKFAIASENPATKGLATDLATTFGAREPFDTSPLAPRGALNGLIVRNGYIVAEWADNGRVDMTFSVTKSFLSTVVGLAWQKGLIRDAHDPVCGLGSENGRYVASRRANASYRHNDEYWQPI